MRSFKFSAYLLSILFAVLAFSSCAYKNREALLKTPYDADTISSVYVVNGNAQPSDYYNQIQPEDELAINNLQNMDLILKGGSAGTSMSNQSGGQAGYSPFKVDAQGNINLPKIGVLKVAGLNRVEAAKLIQQAYEQKELNMPLIDVRIANAYVTLLGEANRQGKFIINREDYELIDLIGDAGGLTLNANKKSAKILRGDKANPEIILVNLENYAFLKNPKLRLRAKDVVYIEPKRSTTTSQNLQTYSTIVQIGLVLVNTAVIIYSLTR